MRMRRIYSVQGGKDLCEKCLFMNGTRSYGQLTFNQSAQSNIEVSDRLVFKAYDFIY